MIESIVCSLILVLLGTNCLALNVIQVNGTQLNTTQLNGTQLDAIELTAKLLLDLDEKIEKCLSLEGDDIIKPVDKFSQLYIPPNEVEIASVREEKFSEVLRDLEKMETQIQEAIRTAQVNRRYPLVVRLRPLLNYVTNIRRNMDLLRNRMVAVTTISTIAFTVNEVIEQFGDVMTGSLALPGGVVGIGDRLAISAIKEKNQSSTQLVANTTTPTPAVLKNQSNATLIS